MTYAHTQFAAPLAAQPITVDDCACYRVPLSGRGGEGRFAIVDPKGLAALHAAGARALYLTGDGSESGFSYVAFLRVGTHHAAMASRAIINAPQGRRVVYINGDRHDLRTANLVIQPRRGEDPYELACQKADAIDRTRQERRPLADGRKAHAINEGWQAHQSTVRREQGAWKRQAVR